MQCPSCGCPVEGAAQCPACGAAVAATAPAARADAVPTGTTQRGYGTATRSFDCENCGAETVYSATQMTLECPYCGSRKVVQLPADQQKDTVQPEAVVPFKIPREESQKRFREWVGGLWFAPGDLQQRAQAGACRGVYLPFWSYDVDTRTSYQGEVGHHRHEERRVRDAQGQERTERTQVTDWRRASGWRQGSHKDVLVCASKGIERSLVVAIEPWPLAERQPYTPAFLAGWEAERYAFDADTGWREHGRARVQAEEQAASESKLRSDQRADTTRGVSIDVRYEGLRSRHLLLPTYISAYQYGGKTFRFMINGATGEVQGERPYSAPKIALAVLAAMALLCLCLGLAAVVQPKEGQQHPAPASGTAR